MKAILRGDGKVHIVAQDEAEVLAMKYLASQANVSELVNKEPFAGIFMYHTSDMSLAEYAVRRKSKGLKT